MAGSADLPPLLGNGGSDSKLSFACLDLQAFVELFVAAG
jgi:hypothetical protein